MSSIEEPHRHVSGSKRVQFTLNGTRHDLDRATVETRLANVVPGVIRKHAVRINGVWYPVKQAFEAATGIPRSDFISHAARDHLADLGFEVRGEVEPHTGSTPTVVHDGPATAGRDQSDESWHTEANVQAAVVTALVSRGWRILSVANTATKEQGIDVIAAQDGVTMGIEVKGFPSRGYADPARAHELKRTSPSTQAGHWYAQAILAAMRLRGKEPAWRSVVALPEFPRYRSLYEETKASLDAAGIGIWWVSPDGQVVPR